MTVTTIGVRGRLLAGGEGVEADLVFDHQLSGRRVLAHSDEQGQFSAAFPSPGDWKASARLAAHSKTQLVLGTVTIEPLHDRELELHVADGRVHGTVVADRGTGVRAFVVARKEGRIVASTASDAEGAYDLSGIEPATYALEAEAEEGFAGPVDVVIEEKTPSEVVLRVASRKSGQGVVVDATGTPVSGAIVRVYDRITRVFEDIIADGSGTYALSIRPNTESVDAIVFAPPHPIAIRRLTLATRQSGSMTIVLGNRGATLRVLVPRAPPWPTLTIPGDLQLPLGLLLMPTFGAGTPRELVDGRFNFHLEEGVYGICDPALSCRTVRLAPFGEAVVDLNAPAKTVGN